MHLLLPYFIFLLILLHYFLRRGTRKQAEREQSFWDRENEANQVRKKDISNLNYITIPEELSLLNSRNNRFEDIYNSSNQVKRTYDRIQNMKNLKILNLTGISNTDLKLSYGVANLTSLTEYDDNFTSLVKDLASLGEMLFEADDYDNGVIILEFGIKIGSDIRSNYYLLADYYASKGDTKKIEYLKQKASLLKSLNKDVILEKLNTY